MNEWELNEERHLLRLLIDAQNGISKLRTLTDLEKFLFIPTFKLQVRVSIGVKKLANNSGNLKLQSIYNFLYRGFPTSAISKYMHPTNATF